MNTAFLSRPEKEQLKLDPKQPHRGYLSVVKDSASKQKIPIEWKSTSRGDNHKPLWEVVPIIMGEEHKGYTMSALTVQKAKEASATLIARSGLL